MSRNRSENQHSTRHPELRLRWGMVGAPDVVLRWSLPFREENDQRWHAYGLYAYLRARHPEILYIGKAVGRTILQRVNDPDKRALFDDLAKQRNIRSIRVIVARVEANENVTRQLILDVESPLIYEIKPWGNIQSCQGRGVSRPGLIVNCQGKARPLSRRTFRDL
jgi:hypothetical protein